MSKGCFSMTPGGRLCGDDCASGPLLPRIDPPARPAECVATTVAPPRAARAWPNPKTVDGLGNGGRVVGGRKLGPNVTWRGQVRSVELAPGGR